MRPIADIEQDIRAAIARVTADGWKIARGVTVGRKRNQCCALGAVILAEPTRRPRLLADLYDIGDRLGLTMAEVDSFTMGFDGDKFACTDWSETAHELGARLAREFVDSAKEQSHGR